MDRSGETDRWGGSASPADHQTDILHAPVLFMQGDLWPSFFSDSAEGSDDLLDGMLPASKTSHGGNK